MKIGIDIGGSHIGIGLIEEDKIIAVKDKILNEEDKKDIENCILSNIETMVSELLLENNFKIEDISLMGIGAPGTIVDGKIVKATNLQVKDFNIVSKLKEKYYIPIQIRNDAKCAGLAEKIYGSLREYDDCLFLCIGTGIGGAAFMNGKLLEPKRYSGLEFGHMVVHKDGKTCSCGKLGCLQAYSSIKALKSKIAETMGLDNNISGKTLREEILIKDYLKIEEDIEEFLDHLKIGLCNLIDIFEPEAICLGGSFSYYEDTKLFSRLIEKINEPKSTFNSDVAIERPKIIIAEFKNDAGIIGATICK